VVVAVGVDDRVRDRLGDRKRDRIRIDPVISRVFGGGAACDPDAAGLGRELKLARLVLLVPRRHRKFSIPPAQPLRRSGWE
jgi:hypothetical protein